MFVFTCNFSIFTADGFNRSFHFRIHPKLEDDAKRLGEGRKLYPGIDVLDKWDGKI